MNRAMIEAGAVASAAARVGVPVEAYRAHREAGERHCSAHRRWEPASAFALRAYPGPGWWRVQESCPEGHRAASRELMARRRAAGDVRSLPAARPSRPCKWGHTAWSRQGVEWRCLRCHQERKARYRAQRRRTA